MSLCSRGLLVPEQSRKNSPRWHVGCYEVTGTQSLKENYLLALFGLRLRLGFRFGFGFRAFLRLAD